MGDPGFWDDQDGAAAITAEHARTTRRLAAYRELERDVEDLEPLAELAEEDPDIGSELEQQVLSVQQRLEGLEEQRLFSGPYDSGDALVTVNAGAGGTDAQDWAEMVLRMEMRWAEKRGFEVELLEVSPGEEAGIKSGTFLVKGENAYGLFASEKGVHRLVRLSPFDAAHRRQTSFAGVEVSPVVQEIDEVPIDDDDLQVDTYRASGAGGQHVNKTDSAVRITHKPTGIVVQCQNERSQSSNKAEAMTMLRSKLLELEERKRREEIAREKGEAQDVNFGSQIRSYVMHPYTMAKDHRTGHEVGDVSRVLDGDLDGFARAYLLHAAHAASSTENGGRERDSVR
jgi:peptide chain release factor 2